MDSNTGERKEKAKLEITLWDDDSISITGPVSHRPVCYMMLEMARDAIFEKATETKPRINGGFRQFIKGKR